MTPLKPPAKLFSVFESFGIGMRLIMDHFRLFAMLSVVPLIATFATLMTLRITGGMTLFWLPLLQTPANFVLGLQCALILRFVILKEFPLIADDAQRRERNRDVLRAGVVYAIVSYLLSGAVAALLYIGRRFELEPVVMAPYAPLTMVAMVLLFFGMRWLWLPMPVALGWDVKGFYGPLRGWPGSMRIGGLFVLCSITVNVLTTLVRYMFFSLGSLKTTDDITGVWAVLDDGAVACGTIVMGILFYCASAHAIASLTSPKRGVS